MKKMILPVFAIGFMFSISSCAKCVTCKNGDEWRKFCDKDNNREDIDQQVDALEFLGWDCRKSSQAY